MPIEARKLMKEGEMLPDVCMKVHMALNGSSDEFMYQPEELDRLISILYLAKKHWKHDYLYPIDSFDFAVYKLVEATIKEKENNENTIS